MDDLDRIAIGFQESKILLAAAELRVFDLLKGEGASLPALLAKTGWDPRGARILLDALVAIGLLDKREGVYRNRPELEPRLVEEDPDHFSWMLRHRNLMFRKWASIEDRVRGVAPSEPRPQIGEAAANENFIRAMLSASGRTAPAVADAVPLEGVRTLADIGGGPGHYLDAFARRKPDLEPYLVDLPITLGVARKLLARSPAFERFRFVAWDAYAEPVPGVLPALDVAFLSQLVHSESPEANRGLFAKLAPRISPGGRIVVHENVLDPGRSSPRAAAVFAVNMLAMTPGGSTYTEAEIVSWGEDAGLERESGARLGERSYLVVLRKPR